MSALQRGVMSFHILVRNAFLKQTNMYRNVNALCVAGISFVIICYSGLQYTLMSIVTTVRMGTCDLRRTTVVLERNTADW